jgi:DNA-binding transcriptional regulator YiaG
LLFSATVKQARQTLGISQEDLAHALKVSYVTINRWENGKTLPNKMAKAVFFDYCESKGIQIRGEDDAPNHG